MSESETPGSSGFGLESAPAREYEDALERLKTFSIQPIHEILNLGELERSITGVGKALKSVVTENGALEEARHPSGQSITKYVLKKPIRADQHASIPGDMKVFTDSTNNTYVVIEKKELDNPHKTFYSIEVPLNDRFDDDQGGYVAIENIPIQGRDIEQEEIYSPASDPKDKHEQQEYARILQAAVIDVLLVSREPTRLPPGIDEQL
ncbi:MAG: hypothetical protein ACR2LN_02530 [Candidatus Levyibacteriota bacterium]